MDYFRISVNSEKRVIDHIVVDNFHPDWMRIAKSLYDVKFDCHMIRHIGRRLSAFGVDECYAEISAERGLEFIEFGLCNGLYLNEVFGSYCSVNVGVEDVGKVNLLISSLDEYLSYMRLCAKFIEKKNNKIF